jgi:prepilin-type N-terminal cleavage/methylation domain-containing protein
MIQFRKNGGYSLVEVLVAISILLLATVGPMTIAVKGIQSSYYARQQATALFLAQEGVEMVVASRNEALITAIRGGTSLTNAWKNWVSEDGVSNHVLDRCRTASGCNFDFANATLSGTTISGYGTGGLHLVSCGTITSCAMLLDTTQPRARYNRIAGSATEYTRVIKLISETDRDGNPQNDGVFIEVTVSWPARVFSNATQSVVLNSAVYPIYE